MLLRPGLWPVSVCRCGPALWPVIVCWYDSVWFTIYAPHLIIWFRTFAIALLLLWCLCVLGWVLKYLALVSPSSHHCPARGWPSDRLSINGRRAYGWVERCSCPDSCSSIPFSWKLIVNSIVFRKLACIDVSWNCWYICVTINKHRVMLNKSRYRDFGRTYCSLLSTRANPWAGKYAPDAQRYMVCLCVYYIAARDYVIVLWQLYVMFMCWLYHVMFMGCLYDSHGIGDHHDH